IGIVGSDVYDKLLLFRGLRPYFPQALFFTTDLDVRLLQAGNYPDTRNLLIASPYGLSLKDDFPASQRDKVPLQGKVAPFRSSYDTASYIGTLRAVCHLRGSIPKPGEPPFGDKPQCGDFVRIPKPGEPLSGDKAECDGFVPGEPPPSSSGSMPVHLYEVGRGGVYELTLLDDATDPLGAENPRRVPWVRRDYHWLIPLLRALFAALLSFPISRPGQRFLGVGRRHPLPDAPDSAGSLWTRVFAGVAVLLAVALALVIYYSHTTDGEEPFELFEGLSIWP